jgi:hypothetical protein
LDVAFSTYQNVGGVWMGAETLGGLIGHNHIILWHIISNVIMYRIRQFHRTVLVVFEQRL